MDKRRNNVDLIDEMMAEKSEHDFFTISIVVGFEKITKFVTAIDDRSVMIMELAQLMKAGGEPLGLIGALRTDEHTTTMHSRIFQEYANDKDIQCFFSDLMDQIEKTFKAAGMRVLPRPNPKQN